MAGDEISPWPSGELVAELIEGMATGAERHLPMNLPNHGQVQNLPDGVVVECIGVTGESGVRPRDTARVGSVLGEYLRRISTSQELTVEAALTGDRTRVLEAMLTDQLAGRLPYEQAGGHDRRAAGRHRAVAPPIPRFLIRHFLRMTTS